MNIETNVLLIALASFAGLAVLCVLVARFAWRRARRLEGENRDLRERLQEAETLSAERGSRLEAERQSHQARVEDLRKMDETLKQTFTALASDALGKNSERFLALVSERFDRHRKTAEEALAKRQDAIAAMVKPLGESLTKFDRAVGEIEKAREGAYRAISEQVKSLAEGQSGLRSETGRLVQALRRPKTRGRWGEYQLRNVLEMADMTEHVDFVEERTVDGADGPLRPDVIVRLPGGKSVIVDAKTPLEAYLTAVETADEGERERLMDDHARQVRVHVRVLASKDYWKALPATPDFVVMFVPGEAFFAAAIEADPELFEYAVGQRVLIATPTTFIALVKAIAYGWQQEKLAENAHAVSALGSDLFERIKVFGGHMGRLGDTLRRAVERYNEGVGSLEARVLPAARRFEELGAVAAGSEIPPLDPVAIDTRGLYAGELVPSPLDAAADEADGADVAEAAETEGEVEVDEGRPDGP